MRALRTNTQVRLAVAAALLLGLAACAEREVILPGEREDIRPADVLAASATTPEDDPTGTREIALPAQVANTDWAQTHGTQANRVSHPALGTALTRQWSVDIGDGDSRKQRIIAQPIVGGGRIYTLDAADRVSATSPDGTVVWTTRVRPDRDDDSDATGGGLAYDGGTLYVSLGFGDLVALDASTGDERWRQRLEGTGSGSPYVRDGLVYLVSGDEIGWAIRADDGRVEWRVTSTPSVTNVLGAPAPVFADGLTVFAFGSGELIATFPRGGLRRWSVSVAGQRLGRVTGQVSDVTGDPVVVGDTIFAGNHSGRIVAFESSSGDRIWTAGEGALGPAWPAGDSLFIVTDRNELIRFDQQTGQVIWRAELPGFLKDRPRDRDEIVAHHGPILAGGRVLLASNDGLLRAFSPVDGSLIDTVEIPGGASSAPVVAGSTLYVLSTRGDLHAFR